MSKPLENYIIRIKSSIDQFDNEGVIREEDRDHIELMTRGSFTKKNGSYYISYKETQTIGFEGCTTTIKIAEDGSRVALLRFCLLYTSPSPRDLSTSRMPSSA